MTNPTCANCRFHDTTAPQSDIARGFSGYCAKATSEKDEPNEDSFGSKILAVSSNPTTAAGILLLVSSDFSCNQHQPAEATAE